MDQAEEIKAELELERDTRGKLLASRLDERIRASMVWGPSNDPNPFYGQKEPIIPLD